MKYEILPSGQVMKVLEVLTDAQTAIVKEANLPPHDLEFHTKVTTNKTSILADGIDTATITASVFNYLDEAQTTWTGDIIFELNGTTQTVATTNGKAIITFNTSVTGEYTFTTNVPNFRNGEVKVVAK